MNTIDLRKAFQQVWVLLGFLLLGCQVSDKISDSDINNISSAEKTGAHNTNDAYNTNDKEYQLLAAAKNGSLETIKKLISQGVDIYKNVPHESRPLPPDF